MQKYERQAHIHLLYQQARPTCHAVRRLFACSSIPSAPRNTGRNKSPHLVTCRRGHLHFWFHNIFPTHILRYLYHSSPPLTEPHLCVCVLPSSICVATKLERKADNCRAQVISATRWQCSRTHAGKDHIFLQQYDCALKHVDIHRTSTNDTSVLLITVFSVGRTTSSFDPCSRRGSCLTRPPPPPTTSFPSQPRH